MKKSCERLWEVAALREGRLAHADADSHERHRASCALCRERWVADERLAALGRALPVQEPDDLEVRRLRAQLLKRAADGASSSERRVAWWRPALVLAAAVAVVFGLFAARALRRTVAATAPMGSPPNAPAASSPAEPFASVVDGHDGAAWSRRRDGRTERVRLDAGIVVIAVRKQAPDERFVVDLPDGEIEVRGTRFEVAVEGGVTTSVRVFEGVVALRRGGSDERVLRETETWTLERFGSAAPPSSSGHAAFASAPRPSAPPPEDQAAAEYGSAMAAYRAQRWAEAAQRFNAFVAAHPRAAEAEDAAFLEASSLARDGRPDAAALVAERFLARHPGSFHARDASILVARAARDRGDCGRARSALSPWRGPDVDAALGRCSRE